MKNTHIHWPNRFLFLVAAMLLLGISSVEAQRQRWPSDYWHEGKLITVDEEMHQGLIKYNLEGNLVQLNVNGQLITYTARKVLYFEIMESSSGRLRTFYVLPFAVQGSYEAPVLFEVLHEGTPLTLLTREYIVREIVATNQFLTGRSYRSEERLKYRYYFLRPLEDAPITEFLGNRKELEAAMGKHFWAVSEYMKVNRLKEDQRLDLLKIVSYYNSLVE